MISATSQPLRWGTSSSAGRSRLLLGLVATAILSLGACGSQVSPEDVAAAGGLAGQPGAGASTLNGSSPVLGSGAGSATDPGQGPGAAGGAGTSTGAGGSAPGSDGGGGGAAPGEPPLAGTNAGDCGGFENGPGISDTTITIGNVADISGPIPGLFQSSQDAVRAFVAFFNATSDICGRKLELKTYDSRTDAGADQQAYAKVCEETFAAVSSMSAFDSGGAQTAQDCGVPDLRTANVTKARANCTTCFGAQGTRSTEWPNAFADFIKETYPGAEEKAAMLYINAGGAGEAAQNEAAALSKRGMDFEYIQGIDTSEFNYSPYVQKLKELETRAVFFVGAYQQSVKLVKAMADNGFKPEVYFRDPTDYNPAYVEQAGEAGEGTISAINFVPFEEASSNTELQTYLAWLERVKPGAKPDFFGVFAWSAARLFVQLAAELGGDLDRASLVAAIAKTDQWTANNLTSPQPVGSEHVPECWRFLQLRDGQWVPAGSRRYTCNGLSTVD